MKMQCHYLSDAERERIHRDSLKILAEVGVLFRSAAARKILARGGATVDEASQIVRIPKELVAQALQTAPKQFTLGARHTAFDFPMPSPFTGYTLDGAATSEPSARTPPIVNSCTSQTVRQRCCHFSEMLHENYCDVRKFL